MNTFNSIYTFEIKTINIIQHREWWWLVAVAAADVDQNNSLINQIQMM